MKDATSRLLAEFLGVFFLCFFGIGAITNDAGLTGVALASFRPKSCAWQSV